MCGMRCAYHMLSDLDIAMLLQDLICSLGRVCDIGSGTGCTGIAAACLGAQATLTDQLCVFPLLQSNVTAALSQCGLAEDLLVIAEYNWGEGIGHLGAPFDLVLVSDCVLPKLYPIEPLVQVGLGLYRIIIHFMISFMS